MAQIASRSFADLAITPSAIRSLSIISLSTDSKSSSSVPGRVPIDSTIAYRRCDSENGERCFPAGCVTCSKKSCHMTSKPHSELPSIDFALFSTATTRSYSVHATSATLCVCGLTLSLKMILVISPSTPSVPMNRCFKSNPELFLM